MNQLTNLSGDEWKHVRGMFSPIFTSGKMKTMLNFIRQVAGSLCGELQVGWLSNYESS
jgi:cytochrome P450